MRIRKDLCAAAALALVLAASPSRADELLRFKSGYEMMVVSHREEKGMIIVTLDGGGEIGFPKSALEMLEEGKPTQRVGPSPGSNRVHARTLPSEKFKVSGRVIAKGVMDPEGFRVGYSMHGDKQKRLSGGALGEGSGGKIGTDIRIRQRPSGMPSDDGPQTPGRPGAGSKSGHTVQVDKADTDVE